MANQREELTSRFIVLPKEGIPQSAWDSPVADADGTLRLKCQMARTLEVSRQELRDCRNEDIVNRILRTRLSRLVLTITEIDSFWISYFSALYLGTAAAPTGSPANEVQTFTRAGTVSGGTFKLSLTLEGRKVTTQDIAFDATNATIQAAVTAARMLFVQPGDVVVTGTWGTAITFTHPDTGRLGRANLPMWVLEDNSLTGSGAGITIAQGTAGDQNYHAFTRSTSKTKQYTTFWMGWEDDADRVEKYINFAVESIVPTLSLDGDVQFVVTLIGMWTYNEILTTFTIPDCNNITPMPVSDCRLSINSAWQTTDINNLTATVNDNIPTDRQSAFAFDGIDPQQWKRSAQPSYTMQFGIFGSEVDSLYGLAYDERTQTPVPVIIHFGMPGHRCSWYFPKTKLAFQNDPLGNAGALQASVIQLDGVAFKDGTAAPFRAEAYTGQTVAYLIP